MLCFGFHTAFAALKVEIEGLTGDIRFNEAGNRINYTLDVVEMSLNSKMVKVAEWTAESRLTPIAAKFERFRSPDDVLPNRTFIVTTILEEPYVMEVDGRQEGNDRYIGYCKDLAELVAQRANFTCKLFV